MITELITSMKLLNRARLILRWVTTDGHTVGMQPVTQANIACHHQRDGKNTSGRALRLGS